MVGMSNNVDQPYTKYHSNYYQHKYFAILQHLQYSSFMIGLNCLDRNILYLHYFVIIRVTTGELSFLFHSAEMRQLLFNYCTSVPSSLAVGPPFLA